MGELGSVSGSMFQDSLSVKRTIRIDTVHDSPIQAIVKSDEEGLFFEAEFSNLPAEILQRENRGVIDEAIELWQSLSGSVRERGFQLFEELKPNYGQKVARSVTRAVIDSLTSIDPATLTFLTESFLSLEDDEDGEWEVETVDGIEGYVHSESGDFIPLVRPAQKDDGGWVPYVGDRGGTGWRNTASGTVSYDDEPPGDVVTDQLSSDQKQEIRQNFNEVGQGADQLLYDEGEVIPLEDRYVGESFMLNTSNGWKEVEIDELRTGGPGPDLVYENQFGEAESLTKEEYERASNPVHSIPDHVEDEVGSVQTGKSIHVDGWEPVAPDPNSSETNIVLESVDGNLVNLRQGTILLDDEHGPLVEWDSVKEGDDFVHPEHGTITYTGESGDRGYDDYEFETEDGDHVYVQFSNAGEQIYKPVDLSLAEPEYHLDGFNEADREELKDTVESVLEGNDIGIRQVLDRDAGYEATDKDPVASYSPSSSDVMFNPEKVYEENIQKLYLKGYETGFLAGDSVEHVVCHELSHAIHAQEGDQPDEEEWEEFSKQDMIEEKLGEYASLSPGELVAEVGALILQGEDIESDLPEVYEAYREFGGPEQEVFTPI